MDDVASHPSVIRVQRVLSHAGSAADITVLSDSARTAAEAASALGIEVGQIASSIVFALRSESDDEAGALLVITSGRNRVDTTKVKEFLGDVHIGRADADFVRTHSGFAIGGVSPVAWSAVPTVIIIDTALDDYAVVWAAAGHPHAVFPTTFAELIRLTGATPLAVG